MSVAEARPESASRTAPDMAADMARVLLRQRQAHIKDGPPSAEKRIEWLDRAIGLIVGHKDAITDALREDFGNRSVHATLLTDVSGAIGPLKHAKENLRGWMKREKRKVAPALLGLFGARAWVDYQPKGVVGVISPWNFPVNLTFTPLAGILAAGNRAMIKPSEFTPRTSELKYLNETIIFCAFVTGGVENLTDLDPRQIDWRESLLVSGGWIAFFLVLSCLLFAYKDY